MCRIGDAGYFCYLGDFLILKYNMSEKVNGSGILSVWSFKLHMSKRNKSRMHKYGKEGESFSTKVGIFV